MYLLKMTSDRDNNKDGRQDKDAALQQARLMVRKL